MSAWSERQPVADLWIDARRGGSLEFRALSGLQKSYRDVRAAAKRRLPQVAQDAEGVTAMTMQHTDVVIAGGGLAGSLAAAMLGRAGIDAGRDRSASGLSAGLPLREARRPADADAAS